MFEPIREDLRAVEREFAHHVQSQVQLIPTIGNYIQNSGGKRNEPAFVAHVASAIAELRGIDAAAVGAAARANFDRVFNP